ncbi:MAG: hypothetical protein BJ554DRAFT_1586, partial [Olpidium bornovanus]
VPISVIQQLQRSTAATTALSRVFDKRSRRPPTAFASSLPLRPPPSTVPPRAWRPASTPRLWPHAVVMPALRQLLRAQVEALAQGPQEPMQAYVTKGQALVNEYIDDREFDLKNHSDRRRYDRWTRESLIPAFFQGLASSFHDMRRDRSRTPEGAYASKGGGHRSILRTTGELR